MLGELLFSARRSPIKLYDRGPAKGVRRVISYLHQNPPHVYYSVDIPMGTNCVPLIADLCFLCYEGYFMAPLSVYLPQFLTMLRNVF